MAGIDNRQASYNDLLGREVTVIPAALERKFDSDESGAGYVVGGGRCIGDRN